MDDEQMSTIIAMFLTVMVVLLAVDVCMRIVMWVLGSVAF